MRVFELKISIFLCILHLNIQMDIPSDINIREVHYYECCEFITINIKNVFYILLNAIFILLISIILVHISMIVNFQSKKYCLKINVLF
jgi:hypothetical protein